MATIPDINISMDQQLTRKFHQAHEYELLCDAIAKTLGIKFVRDVGSEKIIALDKDGFRHEFLSYQEMFQALIVDKQNPSAAVRYDDDEEDEEVIKIEIDWDPTDAAAIRDLNVLNVIVSSGVQDIQEQFQNSFNKPQNPTPPIDARGEPFTPKGDDD